MIGVRKMLKKSLANLADMRRNLSEPNGGLNGLDLAKERTDAAPILLTPVLE
jgi:hypothetical protein